MRLTLIPAAAILVIGLVPGCAPGSGNGKAPPPAGPAAAPSVSVLVLDAAADRALPGAAVVGVRGEQTLRATAGEDGVAVLAGLEAGDWTVTVSAPGRKAETRTVAVDAGQRRMQTLAVKLAAAGAAPPKTPEPAPPDKTPDPGKAPDPAPVKTPEPPKGPAGTAAVTVTITVAGSDKAPAGATVVAICGEKQLKLAVGANGVAVAKDLGKGVWSFNVSAPGYYGVVGAVNVDPEAARSYELPIALDPEQPAAAK